jgi:hypothetical protein
MDNDDAKKRELEVAKGKRGLAFQFLVTFIAILVIGVVVTSPYVIAVAAVLGVASGIAFKMKSNQIKSLKADLELRGRNLPEVKAHNKGMAASGDFNHESRNSNPSSIASDHNSISQKIKNALGISSRD